MGDGEGADPHPVGPGAMPYTKAVLHEMLWFLDLAFIWRAKQDTQPGGFIIPKVLLISQGRFLIFNRS